MNLEPTAFTFSLITSIFGFLASASLLKQARVASRVADPEQIVGLRVTYWLAVVYFAGLGLLTMNWMLGENAALPIIAPGHDGRVIFATLSNLWFNAVACIAVCVRAWVVHRRPCETPEGRAYRAALKHHAHARRTPHMV